MCAWAPPILGELHVALLYTFFRLDELISVALIRLRAPYPYILRIRYPNTPFSSPTCHLTSTDYSQGTINVNINACSLFEPKLRRHPNLFRDFELTGMTMTQSVMVCGWPALVSLGGGLPGSAVDSRRAQASSRVWKTPVYVTDRNPSCISSGPYWLCEHSDAPGLHRHRQWQRRRQLKCIVQVR